MKTLRVPMHILFYREEQEWVAHCLEFDLCGNGITQRDAANSLAAAVRIQIEQSLLHNNPDNLFSRPMENTFGCLQRGVILRTVNYRCRPGSWWRKAAVMLQIDLKVAGVPYTVPGPDGPLYGDFHSLRHTYITYLADAGVSPSTRRSWPVIRTSV